MKEHRMYFGLAPPVCVSLPVNLDLDKIIERSIQRGSMPLEGTLDRPFLAMLEDVPGAPQIKIAANEITFDRYGHLFPDTNKEAARRLDDAIFGGGAKKEVKSTILSWEVS